jgi:micrococcal nuclease
MRLTRLAAVAATAGVVGWAVWSSTTAGTESDLGGEPRRKMAIVVRVVDGDTLLVRTGGAEERVRVLGIDTPEVAHQGEPGKCFGDRATAAMRALVPADTRVALVSDPTQADRDVYERLLRYVELRDPAVTDVGRELILAGAAEVYDSDPPSTRQEEYGELQASAERSHRGRWGAC